MDADESLYHAAPQTKGKAAHDTYDALMTRKNDFFVYVQSYYRCFMKNKAFSEYPKFDI